MRLSPLVYKFDCSYRFLLYILIITVHSIICYLRPCHQLVYCSCNEFSLLFLKTIPVNALFAPFSSMFERQGSFVDISGFPLSLSVSCLSSQVEYFLSFLDAGLLTETHPMADTAHSTHNVFICIDYKQVRV